MIYNYLLLVIMTITVMAFLFGRKRAINLSADQGGISTLHSLPSHYGMFTALSAALPPLLIYGLWLFFETSVVDTQIINELPSSLISVQGSERSLVLNDIKNRIDGTVTVAADEIIIEAARRYLSIQATYRTIITSVTIVLTFTLAFVAYRQVKPTLRARNIVERVITFALLLCSGVAILTTLGIVLSVLFEAIRFFKAVPLQEFLFGLNWSPQMAIRDDQAGSSGAFGAVPVFTGTFMIAGIAMSVAIPIGLLAAIYLSEYAGQKFRAVAKPLLEILAGIPTVVYGFFAALTVAPLLRDTGSFFGLSVASESALAAGLVMGIMIIPFVSSLSDDVIHAVPQALRDGSYGLGATRYETIKYVIFPAALPGIVGGVLLAISRAVGETMIVVMAAGLAANLTANPFQAVTTVTVQIVTLLVGDQEFDSPKTLAAFALGLVLFIFTLILNVIALRVVRKYREQYE